MTEKPDKRYQVGTDNETNDTVRTEVVNDAANFLATMWAKHKANEPFQRVFWTNGKHVEVTAREIEERRKA